jgi:hypothetical protein
VPGGKVERGQGVELLVKPLEGTAVAERDADGATVPQPARMRTRATIRNKRDVWCWLAARIAVPFCSKTLPNASLVIVRHSILAEVRVGYYSSL